MAKYLLLDAQTAVLNHQFPQLQAAVIPNLLRLQDAGFALVLLQQQPQTALIELLQSQGVRLTQQLVQGDSHEQQAPNLGWLTPLLAQIDHQSSVLVSAADAYHQLARNLAIKVIDCGTLAWGDNSHQLTAAGRIAKVHRVTKETDILIEVDLDRGGHNSIETGLGFFDHMLDQIATHANFRLTAKVAGDYHIDDHHSVEDTALALGQALKQALGDKRGIGRFGFMLPMDDCQAQCVLDLSGRPFLKFDATFPRVEINGFATEMVEHFFRSLVDSLGANIHIQAQGDNSHHLVESIFKVFGRALRPAIQIVGSEMPSSKGVL